METIKAEKESWGRQKKTLDGDSSLLVGNWKSKKGKL